MSKTSLAWLAITFLIGGGFMVFIASRSLSNQTRSGGTSNPISWPPKTPGDADPKWLTSFSLVERTGKTVSSEDLKGKPYIASFFFSTCPGVCIQQNQLVAGLLMEFRDTDVQFVSISTDPLTDTPEMLRAYALKMKAPSDRWLFLTGNPRYIRRIGAEMFLTAVSEDGKTHGSKMLLVDREGNFVGAYAWSKNEELKRLKDAMRALAAGKDVKAEGLLPLSAGNPSHRAVDDDEEETEHEEKKSDELKAESSQAEPQENQPSTSNDPEPATK